MPDEVDTTSLPPDRRPRVLLVNRSYWPDAEATGQLLTELAEDLAERFEVHVLVGQPNRNPSGETFVARGVERRGGVTIHRVRHTRFDKTSLVGRAANLATFLVAATWQSLWGPRPDVIVVETDPPLLCLLGAMIQRLRGARLVVYLQDIYPDLAVALGKLRDGWLAWLLRRLMFAVYRRADRVVVLSRDMRSVLLEGGVAPERVVCLANWTDTRRLVPGRGETFRREHSLEGKFVVMYSGNLGLCQRLEDVLDAARLLRDRSEIQFMFVGDGALRGVLEAQVRREDLGNVRFLGYQPREALSESLGAADLHLIPLDARISRFLMPSKLYGILAAGKPLLAIAPEQCELATLTRAQRIGEVVEPNRPEAIAEAIRQCVARPDELAAMGRRGRRLAERHYDRRSQTAAFGALLQNVLTGREVNDGENHTATANLCDDGLSRTGLDLPANSEARSTPC